MNKAITLLIFLLSPPWVLAQHKIIRSLDVKNALRITTDRAGDIYVVTKEGIRKYNKDGRTLNSFSSSQPPTLFDPGNGVRMLTWFRDKRQYSIVTPTLNETESNKIDPSYAIDPWLICTSGDYNILILDAEDWSIKTVDVRQANVLTEYTLDSTLLPNANFVFLREYQNFTFLLDQNTGIHIFNRLGKYLKSIPVTNLSHFNFLGEELYYLKGQTIHFVNLFTAETREEAITMDCEMIVITDERLAAVKDGKVVLYYYTP